MTRTPCPRCGGDRALRTVPAAQSRSGPVSASADPRRTLDCSAGCDVPDATLAPALEEALAVGLTFGAGSARAPRCAACDAALDLPIRATLRSVTVGPDADDPFTLTFGLPLVRCGDCGLDNVPPGVTDDVLRSGRTACGLPPERVRATLLSRLRRRDGRGSP